jgi:hypothetical protein
MHDYRVLFQYFNPDAAGPAFAFTTVLAETPEAAAEALRSIRSTDRNLAIVQVVEANEFETGYTYADVKAQRTELEVAADNRRQGIEQIVALANAEEAGTLRGGFGSGWTELVDGWLGESVLALRAAGLLPDEEAGR